MPTNPGLTGIAYDNTSGTDVGVSGILFTLTDVHALSPTFGQSWTDTTGADGVANFPNLEDSFFDMVPTPPSGYYFSPAAFRTLGYGGPGQGVTVRFYRKSGAGTGSIAGTVTLGGAGVADAALTIGSSNAYHDQQFTSATGTYSFTSLPPGTYNIYISEGGYTFSPTKYESVVSNNDAITGKDFAMTAVSRTFTGTVTAGSGGLSGVTITATGQKYKLVYTATTNASGVYTVSGLGLDTYTVVPTLANYSFSPASKDVYISFYDITNVNFAGVYSPSLFKMSGYVLNGAGTGIQSVNVALDQDGVTIKSTYTNNRGYYEFTSLLAGRYVVTPRYNGWVFTPSSTQVELLSSSLEVNFSAARGVMGHVILGRVRSVMPYGGGSGLPGVLITLSGPATRIQRTDKQGVFNFRSLPAGSYVITPRLSGFSFYPELINGVQVDDNISTSPEVVSFYFVRLA